MITVIQSLLTLLAALQKKRFDFYQQFNTLIDKILANARRISHNYINFQSIRDFASESLMNHLKFMHRQIAHSM